MPLSLVQDGSVLPDGLGASESEPFSVKFPCPGSTYTNSYNSPTENVPIAVIGLSLKFPGEATTCDAFWRMLLEGRSARTEIPQERFNNVAFKHGQTDGETRQVCRAQVYLGLALEDQVDWTIDMHNHRAFPPGRPCSFRCTFFLYDSGGGGDYGPTTAGSARNCL